MTPIRRGKAGTYALYVPRRSGGVVLRSTGTTDKIVYNGMKRMLAELKNARRWTLLEAVAAIPPTVTLGAMYDAYVRRTLDALEVSVSASALAPHITAYLASCKGRGLAARNLENITRQLDSFRTVATTTADITPGTVTAWLASLTTSPGTRRQYLYAVTGFTRYLCDVGVLTDYPLTRVKAPKKNVARMTYHDIATDERIVQAASPQYRSLFAFVKATGCDLSTALATTRRDIHDDRGTVRLRGTKTAKRDVHEAIIEGWAIKYLAASKDALLPGALLFPGLTRHGAARHHKRCCAAIGLTDSYTLKDSRHSIAVRMAKAGYSLHKIAEQLGNSVHLVASVYSVHVPEMTPHVTVPVTRPKSEAK